jgi:hypothetical protein
MEQGFPSDPFLAKHNIMRWRRKPIRAQELDRMSQLKARRVSMCPSDCLRVILEAERYVIYEHGSNRRIRTFNRARDCEDYLARHYSDVLHGESLVEAH